MADNVQTLSSSNATDFSLHHNRIVNHSGGLGTIVMCIMFMLVYNIRGVQHFRPALSPVRLCQTKILYGQLPLSVRLQEVKYL